MDAPPGLSMVSPRKGSGGSEAQRPGETGGWGLELYAKKKEETKSIADERNSGRGRGGGKLPADGVG